MLDVVLDVRWMYVGCTLDDVGCELQIMLDVVLDVCWMCVAVEGAADVQTDTLGATGVQAPAPTLWQRPGFKPRRRLDRMNTMQHTLYHVLTSKLVHMYLHLDFNGR